MKTGTSVSQSPGTRPAPRLPPAGRVPWVLGLPAAVAAVFALLPLVYLCVRALEHGPGYAWDIVTTERAAMLLGRSIALAAVVVAACLVLGVSLAWLTTRTALPWARGWAVLVTLPLAVPSYVAAFAWLSAAPRLAGFTGSALSLILVSFPYVHLPVAAALRRTDPAQEEAARSLGVGPLRTFWRVTLPQLRPAAAGGAVLVALYVFSDFGAVSLMRYDTFTRGIYTSYRASFDRTPAAALSVVLVVLTVALVAAEARTRGGRDTRGPAPAPHARRTPPPGQVAGAVAELVRRGHRRRRRVPARHARLLADRRQLRDLGPRPPHRDRHGHPRRRRRGRRADDRARPAHRSDRRPAPGPGRPSARTGRLRGTRPARHHHRPVARLLRRALRPPAVPGTPLLVGAYAVLFLPVAVAATRAAVLQAPPGLEDVARSLGRRPWQVVREVTVPLAAPGVAAGAALTFVVCMKELPATLLLRPTGMDTLATRLWTETGTGSYAAAAPYAAALILLAAIPSYLLGRHRT